MLRLVTLVLVLLFQPSPEIARAQDPRLTARLDSVTLPKIEALLATARRRGLPEEPLVQKALEGASKGAGGPRIVKAVEAMLGDLARAQQGLGRGANAGELVAGAAALRAGATLEMVDQLRRTAPTGGVAVPLAVFADLVAGGMSVNAAWQSVEELAQRGGDEEEFLELRERLRPVGPSP